MTRGEFIERIIEQNAYKEILFEFAKENNLVDEKKGIAKEDGEKIMKLFLNAMKEVPNKYQSRMQELKNSKKMIERAELEIKHLENNVWGCTYEENEARLNREDEMN